MWCISRFLRFLYESFLILWKSGKIFQLLFGRIRQGSDGKIFKISKVIKKSKDVFNIFIKYNSIKVKDKTWSEIPRKLREEYWKVLAKSNSTKISRNPWNSIECASQSKNRHSQLFLKLLQILEITWIIMRNMPLNKFHSETDVMSFRHFQSISKHFANISKIFTIFPSTFHIFQGDRKLNCMKFIKADIWIN